MLVNCWAYATSIRVLSHQSWPVLILACLPFFDMVLKLVIVIFYSDAITFVLLYHGFSFWADCTGSVPPQ